MKILISDDDCRCEGTQCKKRDTCLRYTDRFLKFYWCDDFSLLDKNNCKFYIKKK